MNLLDSPGLPPVLDALPRARLVGGCVRDMLAGRPTADIDLATPDPPDDILAALAKAGLRAIPTGIAHGTITAVSDGRPFEITTLRRDEETDGRHAKVAWTDDFAQDATRRDFTINAMSLDQSGILHDYFGGAADLKAGRVRFVGPAALRIAEDRLRILRFFRFQARYGIPPPDQDATTAIAAATEGLRDLSAERVWSELKRILAVPEAAPVLRLMHELGVLAAILPGPLAVDRPGIPPDPLLRLAALYQGDLKHLTKLLKLSGAEAEHLAALRMQPVPAESDDDTALLRLLADADPAMLIDRALLAGTGTQALQRRLSGMTRPIFPLEGRDALALGAMPGPHIGQALRKVRSWWLAGGCSATQPACLDQLRAALFQTYSEAQKD